MPIGTRRPVINLYEVSLLGLLPNFSRIFQQHPNHVGAGVAKLKACFINKPLRRHDPGIAYKAP
jgi:hypothetical protein